MSAPAETADVAALAGFETLLPFSGERREIRGGPLPATIHHPDNTARPKGRIVVLSGWSGTRCGPADILVSFAAQLAQQGWLVLRPDLPARGDAEGSMSECGLDAMIEATVKLCMEGDADTPLYLLGLCSGGNVALGAACSSGLRARNVGVIALSTLPFQPARSKSFEHKRRWKNLKQYAAKALNPSTWLRLVRGEVNLDRVKKNVSGSEKPRRGERNLKDSTRDIEHELLAWKGPALFIWGGGDEEAGLARAHYAQLHTSGMGALDKTVFQTISGANHNFYGRAWRRDILQKIGAFIEAPSH